MMVPARNLLRRHYDSYSGHLDDIHPEFHHEKPSSVSGLMAEGIHQGSGGDEEEEGEEKRTRSKQGDENYQGWLQLGIGSCTSGGSELHDAPVDPTSKSKMDRSTGGLLELNLFSDRLPGPLQPRFPVASAPRMAPLFPASAGRGVSLEYRSAGAMASSSSKRLPTLTSYNWGQFICPSGSLSLPVEMSGVMRVVSPPARRQTGVWFLLQPAQNQEEPFLPQISKSYLRIKDGRMTVRLLMKYLADKLGLDDETQVVITCRGQQLPPSLTVQHVRDQIWGSGEAVELLPDSPSAERIMTLQYSKSR